MVNDGVGISSWPLHKDAVTHLAPIPHHAARLNHLTPVPQCVMCCSSTTPRSLEVVFILEWLCFKMVVGEKERWEMSSTIGNCQGLQTATLCC